MAIIFDLDGTLLNTLADLTAAADFALGRQGMEPLSEGIVKLQVGNGLAALTRRLAAIGWQHWNEERRAHYLTLTEAAGEEFDNFSADMLTVSYSRGYLDWVEAEVPAELANALHQDFMEYYAQHSTDLTHPYEGIPELLKQLAADGEKMAVISNKADRLTKSVVQTYFGDGIFEAVTGMKDDVPPKPHPAGALMLAHELDIDPSAFYFVGDAMTDMQTAVSAGMTGIGAAWGFRTEEELRDNGASCIAQTPAGLYQLLRSMRPALDMPQMS